MSEGKEYHLWTFRVSLLDLIYDRLDNFQMIRMGIRWDMCQFETGSSLKSFDNRIGFCL